jgi:hypothetical protein
LAWPLSIRPVQIRPALYQYPGTSRQRQWG